MLTQPRVVKELFEKFLPNKIKEIINLDSLRLQSESFINDKLKLQISDLLYTVSLKKSSELIYLLIEHQSRSEKLMPYRVLKYMFAIVDRHRETTGSDTLPIVYPMVLYSGKKCYNHSIDLFDLFDQNKELARSILFQEFKLIDISQIEFRSNSWFDVVAKTAKNIHLKDFLPFLQSIMKELRKIADEGESVFVNSLLSYICEAVEITEMEKFREIVETGLADNEVNDMTPANYFRQEGRQEGRQQGMQEGWQKGKQEGKQEGIQEGLHGALKSVAKKMLAQNKSINEIIEFTELTKKQILALKKKNI